MLDLISMVITLFFVGGGIGFLFVHRQMVIGYLQKVGQTGKMELSTKTWYGIFIIMAIVGLGISIDLFFVFPVPNLPLRILSILLVWELISALLFLVFACFFILLKELWLVRDHFVNGILIYSLITLGLQAIQFRISQIESAPASMLISAVAYLLNMICIFHILSGVFGKKVYIKNFWSTIIINMIFIVMELSNLVYLVQHISVGKCFDQPISSFADSIYYVLISFFTVGYGDLFPVSTLAKFISLIIVFTGFLFTAVFIGVAMSVTLDRIQEKKKVE